MSLRIVHRPARVTEPLTRPEPRTVSSPPSAGDGPSGGMPTQLLLPMVGALSSTLMMVVMRNGQPVYMLIAAVVLLVAIVSGILMTFSSRGQAIRQRAHQRELYLDYLEGMHAELDEQVQRVREQAVTSCPTPDGLMSIITDPARLWERRMGDTDFLSLRVGTADLPWIRLSMSEADSPMNPPDPVLAGEARRLIDGHRVIAGMPVRVPADAAGDISVIGGRAEVLNAARSLLSQAAALHSPDDLQIALACPQSRMGDWAGLDQLPHMVNARLLDGPIPARRVAPDVTALARLLGGELTDRVEQAGLSRRSMVASPVHTPRMLVVMDEWGSNAGPLPLPDSAFAPSDVGITVIHLLSDRLHEPSEVSARLSVAADTARLELIGRETTTVESITVDRTSQARMASLARTLCPLRLRPEDRVEEQETPVMSVRQLLGIGSPEDISKDTAWAPRSAADFLRVPIGLDDQGGPVLLDLKESAQFGMGPHGICIGATGSGKSEMLRTLVLALAMTHSPEDLSMILVDYKGGAAFSPFTDLPHLAGLIDNLADDPHLTERARASIQGEVVRRQQMLKDAGHLASITHYREARRQGADLPPMPHLFVVIDEFGELLTAEPEFSELFLQIGRIGRSIGVHLLLSSQRIESGKLRGLDTYLSYRLGLRTFSESESQVVLDTKDAFHLPAVPGYGYLKVDTSVYRRFRAGYVSGPVEEEEVDTDVQAEFAEPFALPLYNTIAAGRTSSDVEAAPQLTEPDVGQSLVDACVARLRDDARAVRPVWLPPLPERLTLNDVLSEHETDPGLSAVIGLVDDPAHQSQQPWRLSLTSSGGHVAVIGAPGSGRSTFLRTLTASLALTHTPREVSVYGMDLTGGGLARLEGFPHVGGVATRGSRDRLRRLVEELAGMLGRRERLFQERAIESMTHLRHLHAQGSLPELPSADIVVLVDGFGLLRTEFEELSDQVNDLITRGSSYGLHFVIALGRWNELRINQQSHFGTRLEFRLNDPTDSVIDRKLSQTIGADQHGRMLTDDKLFAQLCLPVLDDVAEEDLGDALSELAQRVAGTWGGPAAAPIRLLPVSLDPAQLTPPEQEPDAVPFGIRQDSMEDAFWELLDGDQHLLVLGDARCGKSTLLRTLARGLVSRFSSDELVIAVMDSRGTVPAAIPEEYLAGHAKSTRDAAGLAASIAKELESRTTMTPAELATSPRVVLMVDDYDILNAGGSEPLHPIVPYLPSARDLGFNVVLTRTVAGITRALYTEAIQGLRDTGGTTFLMSGDRSEGQIMPRVYAQTMPPGRGQLLRRGQRPVIVQAADEPGLGSGGHRREEVA
ncbi:type VII secretion protein EccCa [Propionibacterium australiense]|uniref:Type VII secretion protein EccCa n=1 Tax=Propionibacterium australiense TaxID=119981 RepID=A0A8B3FU13_9ACTN|nr:type VII secretion protein EccCa [Propionibacterium australiense]RLP11389.1 type VII secretion protein EccCa [Propionibacterium australiense]